MNKWHIIFILISLSHQHWRASRVLSDAAAVEDVEKHNAGVVVKKNLESERKAESKIETAIRNDSKSALLVLQEHPSNLIKQLTDNKKAEIEEQGSSREEIPQSNEESLKAPQEEIKQQRISQPKHQETKEKEGEESDEILQNTNLQSTSSPSQHKEETVYLQKSEDLPDSLKYGFSFFLLLSSIAVVFILIKVCKLRTSRAERKYGVQADHSTQELTPLPMAMDEGEIVSDDESNLILYDLHQQQGRIV